MRRFLWVVLILQIALGTLMAQNEKFLQANNAYNESDFKNAIKLYEELLSSEMESPDLYLNLGNAYLKVNELGKAILNYERGLSISNDHQPLSQNLKYAQKQIKTPITAIPDFFLSRYWLAIVGWFSSTIWAVLQLLLLCLVSVAIGFWLLSKAIEHKRIAFYGLLAFSFLFLFSLIAGSAKNKLERNPNQGIIITDDARLLSGASEQSELLLNLSQGVKVKLLDQIDEYYKVELLDKEIGWISTEEIRTI